MTVNLKKLFKYLAASVFAALIFVCFSGFTLTGSAKIRYSGKGTAAFSVISDAAEQEFRQAAQDYADGFTVRSGESDMITLEDVTKTENGYNVEVSFRRLDKVKAMGEFFLQKTSSFVPETSETGEMIRNWEAGMFAVTETIYYKSVAKSVDIDVTTVADGLRLYTAGGKEIAVDELDSYAAGAGDKSTAAAFCLLDVGCVESVTVSFPADIAYYAGGDMRLVNKNTVEMRPVFIEAEITSTEGNMIPETKDVGTIFGYVIYEKGLSPAAICGIVAACVILGGLLAAFFVYLVKLGKNVAPFAANGARGNVPGGNACGGATANGAVRSVPCGAKNGAAGGGAAVALTSATEISAASAAQAEMRTVRGVKEQSVLSRGWKKFLKGDFCTGIRQHKLLYLLLLPAFLYVLIFCYLPMFGLVIAFQDYKILDGVFGSEFIGMKTFRKIFYAQIRGSYRMFRNTIYISLIRIGTNFPLILVFTLLLNEVKNRRAKGVIQTISYIPNFISWIAVGGMAFNLLGENGTLNAIFVKTLGHSFDFYGEPDYWWWILAASSLWKGMGWGTLIYMSALGSISDELYDACTIDGGGRFRQAFTVTIPGVMNVMMLQLILDISSIMGDNYEQIIAMTRSLDILYPTTSVVGTLAYNSVLGGGGFSIATACGLIQGVIGLLLVIFTNRIVKKTDNEGIL